MENIICKKLGIKYPILQGPMAWASDSILSSAVSNLGGLGLMGIGFCPPDIFKDEIKKIKELTDKPYGLNLLTCLPTTEEIFKIILEEKVPVVEIETPPPFYNTLSDYISKLKENGTIVIGKVASVNEAKVFENAGVDILSVKGADGGGHIYGLTGTFTLIPQVVDAVNVPVINSSGIYDGRGMAASFMLGASGIEMGSRFLMTKECPIHENYQNAIINSKEGDTVVTGLSVHDGVRMLNNNLAKTLLKIEKENDVEVAAKLIESQCTGSLRKSCVLGEVKEEGTVTVGQINGMLCSVESVEVIMKELISDFNKIISNSTNLKF